MIGQVPKQEQVLKFWSSSRPSIQKELWRNKLHPEMSSWNKVVSQAEIIEIAENVSEQLGRDRKTNHPLPASGVALGSGGENSRNRNRPADG